MNFWWANSSLIWYCRGSLLRHKRTKKDFFEKSTQQIEYKIQDVSTRGSLSDEKTTDSSLTQMGGERRTFRLESLCQLLSSILLWCTNSFAVPFQHGHFSLHCTHLAQTGAQWDDLHVSTGGAVRPDVKHHTMQAHHWHSMRHSSSQHLQHILGVPFH